LRDASLLGGSVFDLLARERGSDAACVRLATYPHIGSPAAILEEAFELPRPELEQRWRSHLAQIAAL
jgi:hypothetical protein